MALKLMYITNNPQVALIAEEAGVDRIFVDMEYIGKADRQGGMDTVQSHHTINDIMNVRKVLTKAELLVRVNPIHEAGEYLGICHTSSKDEIDAVIHAGADILMLPYFKTMDEVDAFVRYVDGRAKTMLLLETVEAAEMVKTLSERTDIDAIHIGLNDLCLEQGKRFLFQLLADGTVDYLCNIMKKEDIAYGFGGIASPGQGMLPAEYIIRDHYRLGSSCVILSRSFCNTAIIKDMDKITEIFHQGVKEMREIEQEAMSYSEQQFHDNHIEVQRCVDMILERIQQR